MNNFAKLRAVGEERLKVLEFINNHIKSLQCTLSEGAFGDMHYEFLEPKGCFVEWRSSAKKLVILWDKEIFMMESSPIAARLAFYKKIDEIITSFSEQGRIDL